jgi:hypothetical protein
MRMADYRGTAKVGFGGTFVQRLERAGRPVDD